ncbi:Serine phosphatase RsbU, regulator of sigma subunit [Modicisalibacter ilicicola DSM 19980]|uniref:Serine phosphatase RsbU, regulator of sigma subunit n=1 Tax=Modicisalibacter ilicicola DSM 19980 TaxID=1121942 RepID=A0A1M4YKA9_9GAMM|nr:PP2C family protein-serine/threonine phosphatase [Halomonas ilicicola]SHF06189.1 Serine phosphatase RsbU, regulator of sigma subunit [Halomonas ilicicola DSM 19980]
MPSSSALLGLIDLPGAGRDALVKALAGHGFDVVTADDVENLAAGVTLVVAHARAVSDRQWSSLVRGHPVLVIAETYADDGLLEAISAGVVGQVVDPLRHGAVLSRLIGKALEQRQVAEAHARERAELIERNETLETHLAMLRLDQQAGGQIQSKLLPPSRLSVNGVQCEYCLTPSLYLSGDFLDFQRFDDRYSIFYFADVSGHGASSAFVTVLLKYLCNRWLNEWDGESPEALAAEWLTRLNAELLDTGIDKHATLFVGVIDHQRRYLHYSLGAQLPMPLLASAEGLVVLEGEGMPVGLFPKMLYSSYGCALPSEFRLWLCSDGVLECLPGSTLESRLEELYSRVSRCSDVASLRAGLGVGRPLGGGAMEHQELPDDLTIMKLSGFDHDNS